jgi:hypothetical protein
MKDLEPAALPPLPSGPFPDTLGIELVLPGA